MHPRVLLAAAAAVSAAALTACASNTDGSSGGSSGTTSSPASGQTASGSSSPSFPKSSASSASSGSSSGGITGAALAEMQRKALQSVKSLHLTLGISLGGNGVTGAGDETLSGGKLKAAQISEKIGGAEVSVIIVDNTVYMKLPPGVAKSGKPWTKITANSSNPVVRQIAPTIQNSLASASVANLGGVGSAATSAKDEGTTTVDGVSAHHYTMVIDTSRLPADFPNRSALAKAGVKSLPLDVYLDGQNRPVRFVEKFTVSGQSVSVVTNVGKYDQPVTISAPPASQVGTG